MLNWSQGLFVSLIFGNIFTSFLLVFLRIHLEEKHWGQFVNLTRNQRILTLLGVNDFPPLKPSEKQVPIWLVGISERLFFTFIIANEVGGGAVAMVAWVAMKMLSARPYREKQAISSDIEPLPFEFAGLMGNLSSMFFALIGGLIITSS